MSTKLTSIFGTELIAYAQNRQADREFAGFAGAHGLTSILLGSRGKAIVVSSIVRGYGRDYKTARADAESKLAIIESYQFAQADDYSFQGDVYYSVVWTKIEKIPDSSGKVFSLTSDGTVLVRFIAAGRSMAQ